MSESSVVVWLRALSSSALFIASDRKCWKPILEIILFFSVQIHVTRTHTHTMG